MAKEYTSLVEMELAFKVEDTLRNLLVRKSKIDMYQTYLNCENAEMKKLEESIAHLNQAQKKNHEKDLLRQLEVKKNLFNRYQKTTNDYQEESKNIASVLLSEVLEVASNPRKMLMNALNEIKKQTYETNMKGYLAEMSDIINQQIPNNTVIHAKSKSNGKEL